MLTCSSCDSGWHTGCLQPPLAAVPAGDWYCPECEAAAAASGGPSSISKQQPVRITVAGQPVAWVEQAKYLGSIFTSDGGLSAELSRRRQLAATAFQRLYKPVWQRKCIQLSTKMRIYRAMVSSVLLYAGHSWAVTAPQLEELEVLQRKQLRSILGPESWVVAPGGDVAPKRISNEELMTACQQPSIALQLQRQRGCWVGHILRMPDHRLAKQMFFGTIVSSAPPQRNAPAPLLSLYAADVRECLPSHVLRSMSTGPRNLFEAAANKSAWNECFSLSS